MGRMIASLDFLVTIFAALAAISQSQMPPSPSAAAAPNAGEWQIGQGTWYGPPNGAGTNAGACGYGELQGTPYDSNTVATSDEQFNGGLGCGACFEVRCINNTLCREEPTTVVVVTNRCPECAGNQLDFSGTAFGNLAQEGLADELRAQGIISIEYRRTLCNFPTDGITFEIVPGSNEYWVAFVVKYVPGYGELRSVEAMWSGSNAWVDAAHLYGAVWQINGPVALPLMVRLMTADGEVVTCLLSGITSFSAGGTSTCGAATTGS